MGLSRRQFTKEFKLAAIQRLEMGASVAEVARAFEVNPNVLHRGRREFRPGPGNAFPGLGKRRGEEGRVAPRERKIGQQALEIDLLKGCVQRIDAPRKRPAFKGQPLSTSRSQPKGTPIKACPWSACARWQACAGRGFIAIALGRQDRTPTGPGGMRSSGSRWSFPATAGDA